MAAARFNHSRSITSPTTLIVHETIKSVIPDSMESFPTSIFNEVDALCRPPLM